MAETELTKEIKKALLYYTKADQSGVYGCYEVCLGAGYGDEYVDYMTMSSTNVFRAYEIKVSLSNCCGKTTSLKRSLFVRRSENAITTLLRLVL